MNNKKTIYAITVLTSIIILSVVFFILVKNNKLYSNLDREAIIYGDSHLEAAESDGGLTVVITDISESANSSDNETPDEISNNEHKDTNNELDVEDVPETREVNKENISDIEEIDTVDEAEIIPIDTYDTITISAAGDVTLGRDESFGWERTFDHELELQDGDFAYFFNNVKHIFEADDLTIVNLETTLTTANKKADKKFRFKADPSYTEILKQGNIEAVSIANNNTLDFLDKGYQDTLKSLNEAGIGYYGYEHKYITDIRGIKIGVLGYYSMKAKDKLKNEIEQAIDELKSAGTDLVIIMFHWGIESDYWPNSAQKELAYFSIDHGADLVLGSHPHVLQGIDEYKGKQIVYSLANFCFGGNKNPKDKDTMIYVQRFNFKNGELFSQEYDIIPCSISSVTNRNNYQPTPLEGEEAKRVLKKINKYSDL